MSQFEASHIMAPTYHGGRPSAYETYDGVIVPVGSDATIADTFRAAGADFHASKIGLQSSRTGQFVKGQFVLEKDGSGAQLGIVGSKYSVFQSASMVEFLESLQGFEGFRLTGVTALHEGAIILAMAEMGERFEVRRMGGTVDQNARHLLIAHSFGAGIHGNAQLPLLIIPGVTNLSCMNQLPGMWTGAKDNELSFKIRHTVSLERRVKEAQEAITASFALQDRLATVAQQLEEQRMSVAQCRDFAETLLADVGVLTDEAREKLSTRTRNRVERESDEIVELFQNGVGNHGLSRGDALNGVTEWIDHKRTAYRKASQNAAGRFKAATLGDGPSIKRRAVRMLTA